jgi:heme A synthase
MRALTWLALALVLAIVVASAMLRLSSGGIDCTPWPACVAEAVAHPLAADDAAAPPWHGTVRLVHRLSASAAGIVFLLLVVFGFGSWDLTQRVAGFALLALATALALIGRATPSPLPAVVLANLLGGHLLLAALAWLLARPDARSAARTMPLAAPALVLMVLATSALGGLVSARGAMAACVTGCDAASAAGSWAAALAALDVWQANGDLPAASADAMRQGLLQLHVAVGVLLLLAAGFVTWRTRKRATPGLAIAVTLLLLCLADAALGLGALQRLVPLGAATAHSLLAGLALSAAFVLWRATRSPRPG